MNFRKFSFAVMFLLVSSWASAWQTAEFRLYVGQSINYERFCLIQQADGNLVIYAKHKGPISGSYPAGCTGEQSSPIWSTVANPASVVTIFQRDGNLVQYDANWNPTWSSGTGGRPDAAYTLELSSLDGSLKLFPPGSNSPYYSTPGVTPPQQPNTCPGGVPPSLYTVCVNPSFQSRFTYRFQACSAQQAQAIASQSGWAWGPCP